MKASELRILNLVTDEFYPDFDKIITVESIGELGINITPSDDGKPYGMHSATLDYEYTFDKLKGIPLAEEWLENFGFEKQDKITWSFGYEKHYDVYRKNELTYNGIQATWWYHGVLEHQPEYVHQLQNLYFCLCGEELTIANLKQNQQQSQSE